MLGRLRKVFAHPVLHADRLAPHESIKTQLAEERRKIDIEHRRTDGLARLLNDYRAQDSALRR